MASFLVWPSFIRLAMYSRVRGSETILVITMCQSAELAWRSPLRLSRWRWFLPLEMESDLPAWARGTPREVKEILLVALDARVLSKKKRRAIVCDLTERIELLGEQAHPHDANRKLVKHLTNQADALFTFLADPAIDATNWRGEQAIRPAVVNRKAWGGNRTWRGAATQGRIMSALRTAVQQGIDPIEFLVRLARAPDTATVNLFA